MSAATTVFVGQTLLTFNLYTGYTGNPDSSKILVEKPNGAKVEWTGSFANGVISYDVVDGDIDMDGEWRFQSWISVSGKVAMGTIAVQIVEKSLK